MGAYSSVVLLLTIYFELILCQVIEPTVQDVSSNLARGLVNIHESNIEAVIIPIRTGEKRSVRYVYQQYLNFGSLQIKQILLFFH